MESESFSLALQQRAAREVVSEEMPRRALATRLLLFCEITSALLMIELGLFAHVGAMAFVLIIMPVLPHMVRLYAALCLSHRSTDGSYSLRPQLLFASILTTPRYSSFGLCRGQKENSLNTLTTMFARFACAAVLVYMVLNACEAKYPPSDLYYCQCLNDDGGSGKCTEFDLWKFNGPFPYDPIDHNFDLPLWDENDLCRHFKHLRHQEVSRMKLCNEVRLPVVLNSTCLRGYMDAFEYHYCRKQNLFYPELCNAKFKVCGIFNDDGEAYRDTFILQVCCLAPLMGLALMVLILLVGLIVAKQTNQPSLMNVSENRELRQRIRTKACHFELQLQKEQLEHSIWCPEQNFIMDWWCVSVNIVDSSLVYCNASAGDHFEFRSIPRVRRICSNPMPEWDQSFISMLVSQVGNPYSPKVGRSCHFLNNDCMLN